MKLEVERVPLANIVNACRENLAAAIAQTRASVHCGHLPVVLADERKLVQVFQNLIANAIKFRRPDIAPDIQIKARAGGGVWTISVEDNGIGFDEKYADRIFEVFQRLHGVGQYQGNGIGLAVCRRVIEHHGGKLWANSKPGQGPTFLFTLPEPDEAALRNFGG